jgi:succinyl-diaminopimelate desuccinylase
MLFGHKGALWLRASCSGRAAHGSTPHLGENAIYKAARAATRLEQFEFNAARHPVLGPPTLNVGTIRGGAGINSVPDHAELTVDIRLVPGMDSSAVAGQIGFVMGEECSLSPVVDLPAVWSDPSSRMSRLFAECHHAATGLEGEVAGANYFTDASVFAHAFLGTQTVVCGPGEPAMAHMTDEYCEVAKIVETCHIYSALLRKL